MATLYLPAKSINQIKESGKKIAQSKGIKVLKQENGMIQLQLMSGDYVFEIDKL